MRSPTKQQTRIASLKRRTTMKLMHTIRRTVTAKLILGVLISPFAFTVAANAQPAFSGTFVLTEEARWNHVVLPAGEYSIYISSIAAPAVLHLKNSDHSFYTSTPMVANGEKGAARLNITVQGNERRVRSLNLPGIHKTLIFEPMTRAEREMVAKTGHTETMPVVTAQE
jgi:hypothetical protein